MTTWLILNSVGIAVISVVLYAALRQLGFVLHRVSPPGARDTPAGPRVGEDVSRYLAQAGVPHSSAKPRLIVFGSDSCSICASVRAGAEVLSKTWKSYADILLIYDSDDETNQGSFTMEAQGLFSKRDRRLRRDLGVTFVPFGLVINGSGVVVGKGLVNEIGHLESLLELERRKATEVGLGDSEGRPSAPEMQEAP